MLSNIVAQVVNTRYNKEHCLI